MIYCVSYGVCVCEPTRMRIDMDMDGSFGVQVQRHSTEVYSYMTE
jgi:hypothetical protein